MTKTVTHLEAIWEKHSVIISIVLSIIIGLLYYIEIITNIKSVLSDIIAFASIVIGINGVFITLVISIKETTGFKRLKNFIPDFEVKLFNLLKSQTFYGLTVVFVSIIILLLPASPSNVLSAIGVSVWSFFFATMTINAYFTINLLLNLILSNEKESKANERV